MMKTDLKAKPENNDLLTERVIGVFFDVYNELGYGFLESVYKEAMRRALVQAGLQVEVEHPISIYFRGEVIGTFRADLVVDRILLLELKACEALNKAHEAQTLNYLRSTTLEVSLLLNFGPEPKVKRLVMYNESKQKRSIRSVLNQR